jgi:hypothetical protein
MQMKSVKKADQVDANLMDDLIVKRKGGGSIIDQRPLFSNEGE